MSSGTMLELVQTLLQPVLGMVLVAAMVCTIAWPAIVAILAVFGAWATYAWPPLWKLSGWIPLLSYGYTLQQIFAYKGCSNLAPPAIMMVWVGALAPYWILFAIFWHRTRRAKRTVTAL